MRLKSFQRNFGLSALLSVSITALIVIRICRYQVDVPTSEIPILGAARSDVNLYFPSVGRRFLPRVPEYNEPPAVRPRTPLFIPFTRNSMMLQQAVLSYIAAGWPRADIVIIDNSGTLDSNNNGVLSPDNPLFLDYRLFRQRYGISILQTPTLLSFSQLQNFMLRQAIARNWPYYFWSHMDIAVISDEDDKPYKSFYRRILDVLASSGLDQRIVTAPGPTSLSRAPETVLREELGIMGEDMGPSNRLFSAALRYQHSKRRRQEQSWAVKFFNFDYLVLVNVEAWRNIGAWDTFIPYYHTDCDFYARINMSGYTIDQAWVGYIYDVAEPLPDLERRFFPATGAAATADDSRLNSNRHSLLRADLAMLMTRKNNQEAGRNTWQFRNETGSAAAAKRKPSEPWSYDPRGFQKAWWAAADHGRELYAEKWGTLDCKLFALNRTLDDAWKMEYLDKDSEEYARRQNATIEAKMELNTLTT